MNDNVEAIYGLTPMQEGMLYHKMVNDKDTSYHIQNAFWFQKELDEDTVRQVMELLTEKHEVFRTAFMISKSTGVPWQVLLKNRKVPVTFRKEIKESEEKVIKELVKNDLDKGFDLQTDCLIRLIVVSFGKKRHYLMFSFHHIIMDGWCLSIVLQDFLTFYDLLSSGTSFEQCRELVLAERRKTGAYKDYVQWLKQKSYDEDLQYFRKLLCDYKESADIMTLGNNEPVDSQVSIVCESLSKCETDALRAIAYENQLTISCIAEAGWGILLQRYNYTKDVVFGKVVSGRNVPIKGMQEKVGLFINSVPVRVICTDSIKFTELIQELNQQDIETSRFEHCGLADILHTSLEGKSLIKTILVYENYDSGIKNQEDLFSKYNIKFSDSREQTNYNVSISFNMVDNCLRYQIMYKPNLYSEIQMQNLAINLKNIFLAVAKNPEIKVCDIDCISKNELEIIKKQFNKEVTFIPKETIPDILEEQVKESFDKVAIVYQKKSITYRQLNCKINALAHKLKTFGIKKGDYIAIFAECRIETIAAIYAVLKAEAVYVPIDPKYPVERIQYILEDCKPKLILKDKSEIDTDIPSIFILDKQIWEGNFTNPNRGIDAKDLAYCIYTSGTTGKPKGVMVEHRGVVNLRDYFVENIGIQKNDTILQFANIVFDASVWEMTMGLLTGAKLVIPTPEEQKDSRKFVEFAKREKISVATLPPIFYVNLEGFHPRLIITAGSETSRDIVIKASKDSEYINAYGPTEFTVCATHWKYKKGDELPERIPIGVPVRNSNCFILNGTRMCGIGVPGELCVTGAGIARGYLNRKELTQEKFVDNPYGKGKLYRTGDLARWLSDGNIEFLGRIDEQVKIHGFRIELGEIESALRRIDLVEDVAVIARKDTTGELAIYTYLVIENETDILRVKECLKNILPEYMLPAYWMKIDKIPVTRNGKLDMESLPIIEGESRNPYVAPSTKVEEILCEMFQEVLMREQIGIDDNFFEIGGDSIKAMKLVSKMEGNKYNISISSFLQLLTVRNIADYLEKKNVEKKPQIQDSLMPVFYRINEIENYLEESLNKLWQSILSGKIHRVYGGSAMQHVLLDKGILTSGIAIKFHHNVDLVRLNKVLTQVLNENELMRSLVTLENNEICIREYEKIEKIEIPAIDISNATDSVKLQCKKYFEQQLESKDKWSKQAVLNRILYEMVLVKYEKTDWILYMPFCHLIFDGMSADILRNSIQDKYAKDIEIEIDEKDSFYNYVLLTKMGPNQISDSELIDKFHLEKFEEKTVPFDYYQEVGLKNATFHIKSEKLRNMEEQMIWNICFKLFDKMISENYGTLQNPIAILFAQRKYAGRSFYNKIGAYLDLMFIPYADRETLDFVRVKKLFEIMEQYDINFTSLIYDKNIREQYKRTSSILQYMNSTNTPVFNFLGVYQEQDNLDRLEDVHNKERLSLNVDIVYRENEIIILGFCKEGKEKYMLKILEESLKSYI